jgi:hypothetical protein
VGWRSRLRKGRLVQCATEGVQCLTIRLPALNDSLLALRRTRIKAGRWMYTRPTSHNNNNLGRLTIINGTMAG